MPWSPVCPLTSNPELFVPAISQSDIQVENKGKQSLSSNHRRLHSGISVSWLLSRLLRGGERNETVSLEASSKVYCSSEAGRPPVAGHCRKESQSWPEAPLLLPCCVLRPLTLPSRLLLLWEAQGISEQFQGFHGTPRPPASVSGRRHCIAHL